MNGKIYMIILDGAADRSIPELNGLTPLEAANKPVLDNFAKNGQQSVITIIDKDISPESDSGTMALLSYNPLLYYPGRGTLEGIGSGMVSEYNYFASFRINFACYNSDKCFLDRRTARDLTDAELQELAEELRTSICLDSEKKIDFRLLAFGRHRGILCLVSNTLKLSGNVSNTDPGFIKKGCFSIPVSDFKNMPLPCVPLDHTDEAKNTAYFINLFTQQAQEILEKSKTNLARKNQGKMQANCILVRDGGILPDKLPSFYDKYHLKLGMFGQLPSEKAIADLIGAEFNYTKALELQLDDIYLTQIARDVILNKNDVVYIHLKGPDEPGHDQAPHKKVQAIEKIDKYFMSELKKHLSPEDMVIVTCDHATPCTLGIHSSDPVPILICGQSVEADGTICFSEKDAALGKANIFKATDIFHYVRNLYLNCKKIQNIRFRYILNSNAEKALEAEVEINNGYIGRASAPSAIIPGRREVKVTELNNKKIFEQEKNQLNTFVQDKILTQNKLDNFLGKHRKNFGSDFCLTVSLAFAKAIAKSRQIYLSEYLFELINANQKIVFPKILVPIFSGGIHQKEKADTFQQIMVCINTKTFMEAFEISKNISQAAEIKLKTSDTYSGIASSGGFLTKRTTTPQKLEMLNQILHEPAWKGKVSIAVDVAAEHLQENDGYRIDNSLLTPKEFYKMIENFIQKFHICFIEDPFDANDFELWKSLMNNYQDKIQIIGDDLFATQKEYIDASLATGAVIKMNQVGNLTDTIAAIQKLRNLGMTICISHRSHETEDVTMCDLAIAASAEYIKIGGVKRGERMIKYNQLLRLEERYHTYKRRTENG